MLVYRICKQIYASDLSGMGAGLYGGRWNPVGINMVYTSSSVSLACLEYLVHNAHLLSTAKICLVQIEVRDTSNIMGYKSEELPENWNSVVNQVAGTQQIGKDFVSAGIDYILKVPSAVVPGEHNLLVNPLHPDHEHTKIVKTIDPFLFDQRILNLVK